MDMVIRIPTILNPEDFKMEGPTGPNDLGDESIWRKGPNVVNLPKILWLNTMKQEVTLENVAKRQAKIVQEMGKKWMVQVFPDMTARPEWGRALNQEKEAGNDDSARTITRSFHPRQVTGKNKTSEIGVQRFAVLVAEEEQGAPVQDDGQLATST